MIFTPVQTTLKPNPFTYETINNTKYDELVKPLTKELLSNGAYSDFIKRTRHMIICKKHKSIISSVRIYKLNTKVNINNIQYNIIAIAFNKVNIYVFTKDKIIKYNLNDVEVLELVT